MTLPNERTRAVQRTRRFLRALLHKQFWQEEYPGTPWPFPRVRPPKRTFEMVRSLLKHYPCDYDLEQAAEGAPRAWGDPTS